MLGELILNYIKSLFFCSDPYSHQEKMNGKPTLFTVAILYAFQILISTLIFCFLVIALEYLSNHGLINHENIGEILGEAVPASFIAIQVATAIFIAAQLIIMCITTRFVVNINHDINKYIVSLINVSSTLMWFWVAFILNIFFAGQEAWVVIYFTFMITIYLLFIYRNIFSAIHVLHLPKRVAVIVTSWPLILLIYILNIQIKALYM